MRIIALTLGFALVELFAPSVANLVEPNTAYGQANFSRPYKSNRHSSRSSRRLPIIYGKGFSGGYRYRSRNSCRSSFYRGSSKSTVKSKRTTRSRSRTFVYRDPKKKELRYRRRTRIVRRTAVGRPTQVITRTVGGTVGSIERLIGESILEREGARPRYVPTGYSGFHWVFGGQRKLNPRGYSRYTDVWFLIPRLIDIDGTVVR